MENLADLKEITAPINAFLKTLNFMRRGKRQWYRESSEIGQLFWLDRFRFEPKNRLYLLGGILRLNGPPKLGSDNLTLQGGIDEFSPVGRAFMNALDQAHVFESPGARAEAITAGLQGTYARLLAGMNTEADVVKLFREIDNMIIFNIHAEMRPKLGM